MPPRRALSIRQPYAELILCGVKTIEYRSRPTKIIGERFYIYAARKWAGVVGHDAPSTLTPDPSPFKGRGASMPTGVIVGSAVISHVTNGGTGSSAYHWHLTDVHRYKKPRPPRRQPQPVWFRPF